MLVKQWAGMVRAATQRVPERTMHLLGGEAGALAVTLCKAMP